MGFNEFKELFTALNGWKQNFMMVDRDNSGSVEPHELSQSITNMGELEHIHQIYLSLVYLSLWFPISSTFLSKVIAFLQVH